MNRRNMFGSAFTGLLGIIGVSVGAKTALSTEEVDLAKRRQDRDKQIRHWYETMQYNGTGSPKEVVYLGGYADADIFTGIITVHDKSYPSNYQTKIDYEFVNGVLSKVNYCAID